jgi:hypothetical protein
VVLAASAAAGGWRTSHARASHSPWERQVWTTPPLDTLAPPAPSRTRWLALVVLRAQLLIAVALLLIRLVQVGLGS